jgi:hypothetical protein
MCTAPKETDGDSISEPGSVIPVAVGVSVGVVAAVALVAGVVGWRYRTVRDRKHTEAMRNKLTMANATLRESSPSSATHSQQGGADAGARGTWNQGDVRQSSLTNQFKP